MLKNGFWGYRIFKIWWQRWLKNFIWKLQIRIQKTHKTCSKPISRTTTFLQYIIESNIQMKSPTPGAYSLSPLSFMKMLLLFLLQILSTFWCGSYTTLLPCITIEKILSSALHSYLNFILCALQSNELFAFVLIVYDFLA